MRWRFETRRGFAALLALAASLLAAPAGALSLQEVLERAKPAVVLLSTPHAGGKSTPNGTGFLISKDGKVCRRHMGIAPKAVFEKEIKALL